MKKTWGFSGDVFRFGQYYGHIDETDNVVTTAESDAIVKRNIAFKIKDVLGLKRDAQIEFDLGDIFLISREDDLKTCPICGTRLADGTGKCPICNDGEEDYF